MTLPHEKSLCGSLAQVAGHLKQLRSMGMVIKTEFMSVLQLKFVLLFVKCLLEFWKSLHTIKSSQLGACYSYRES